MKNLKKSVMTLAAALLLVLSFNDVRAADPWHRHHHHGGRWASYGPSYTSAYAPPVQVSLQVFYDQLAPYGTWINDPYYGYVWVPAVDAGFRPYYSNGYWAYTDYGNTWVSYYDWGWAPFHYGRWTYDAYYGWIWVPDTVWGPAWVGWRSSNDYYGWAPLAPGWGVSYSAYNFPVDWWVFCSPTYVYDHHFYWHCNEPRYNTTIINNTTIVNNTYVTNNVTYIQGPSSADYERHTGQKPQMYQLRELDQAGVTKVQNNQIEIYRPQVSKAATDKQVAPVNVVKADRTISKPEPISVNKGQPQFKSDVKQVELNKNLQPAERNNTESAKPGVNGINSEKQTPAQGQPQKQNIGEPKQEVPQRVTPQQQPRKEMNQEPGRVQPQAQPQQKQWEQKQQPNVQPKQVPQQQPQQRGWQQQEPQRQQQPKQQFEPNQQPRQQFEQPRQEQPKQQFEQPRQAPPRGEPQLQPKQQFEQPRQEPMQQQRPQFQPQQQPQQRQMEQPRMQPQQQQQQPKAPMRTPR